MSEDFVALAEAREKQRQERLLTISKDALVNEPKNKALTRSKRWNLIMDSKECPRLHVGFVWAMPAISRDGGNASLEGQAVHPDKRWRIPACLYCENARAAAPK